MYLSLCKNEVGSGLSSAWEGLLQVIFQSKPPEAFPSSRRERGTAEGGFLKKITTSNPFQAEESPLQKWKNVTAAAAAPVLIFHRCAIFCFFFHIGF